MSTWYKKNKSPVYNMYSLTFIPKLDFIKRKPLKNYKCINSLWEYHWSVIIWKKTLSKLFSKLLIFGVKYLNIKVALIYQNVFYKTLSKGTFSKLFRCSCFRGGFSSTELGTHAKMKITPNRLIDPMKMRIQPSPTTGHP